MLMSLFSPTAKQYPRKFADQRDSGYFLGVWDEGPPTNQLYYTNEVRMMFFVDESAFIIDIVFDLIVYLDLRGESKQTHCVGKNALSYESDAGR